VVNDLENSSTTEKVVQLLEEQLAYMKKQNEELSIKLDCSLSQNKALAEQICQLTKALLLLRFDYSSMVVQKKCCPIRQ